SSRRRHTRCLSDWSSDVCSSDLTLVRTGVYWFLFRRLHVPCIPFKRHICTNIYFLLICIAHLSRAKHGRAWPLCAGPFPVRRSRSEERRVGKECGCGRARKL